MKPIEPKNETVAIEVPPALAQWVRCLRKFYESPAFGSCEFHKTAGANHISKYAPRLFYTKDELHLI